MSVTCFKWVAHWALSSLIMSWLILGSKKFSQSLEKLWKAPTGSELQYFILIHLFTVRCLFFHLLSKAFWFLMPDDDSCFQDIFQTIGNSVIINRISLSNRTNCWRVSFFWCWNAIDDSISVSRALLLDWGSDVTERFFSSLLLSCLRNDFDKCYYSTKKDIPINFYLRQNF